MSTSSILQQCYRRLVYALLITRKYQVQLRVNIWQQRVLQALLHAQLHQH